MTASITSILKRSAVIIFWVLAWQLLCLGIDQPLYFAGPLDTCRALYSIAGVKENWIVLGRSGLRMISGFLCGIGTGILLSCLSYELKPVRRLLAPVITLLKSIPIASIIVLLLAWFSSLYVSVFVAGLVTFPIVYFDILDCLQQIDPKLLQVADVFRISFLSRLRYLFLPEVMDRLSNSIRITAGMSIRAGVAAELIGIPLHSVGEAIYEAKLYFNIADLFAWTVLIVVFGFLLEKMLLFICTLIRRRGLHDQS